MRLKIKKIHRANKKSKRCSYLNTTITTVILNITFTTLLLHMTQTHLTNVKLYGTLHTNQDYDYFSSDVNEYVIDTWKLLVYYKNNKSDFSQSRLQRYENILWRRWYMNRNRKSKYIFNSGITNQCLFGPMVVL